MGKPNQDRHLEIKEQVYTLYVDAASDGGWTIGIEYPDGTLVSSDNVYSDDELDENYDLILGEEED